MRGPRKRAFFVFARSLSAIIAIAVTEGPIWLRTVCPEDDDAVQLGCVANLALP